MALLINKKELQLSRRESGVLAIVNTKGWLPVRTHDTPELSNSKLLQLKQ